MFCHISKYSFIYMRMWLRTLLKCIFKQYILGQSILFIWLWIINIGHSVSKYWWSVSDLRLLPYILVDCNWETATEIKLSLCQYVLCSKWYKYWRLVFCQKGEIMILKAILLFIIQIIILIHNINLCCKIKYCCFWKWYLISQFLMCILNTI